MAPRFGRVVWDLEPRCQADPGRVGAAGEGRGGRAGPGRGLPGPLRAKGTRPRGARVCGWEVAGVRECGGPSWKNE